MALDGRYPAEFAQARHLEDFLRMNDSQLDRIMLSYGLHASDYDGTRMGHRSNDVGFGDSERRRMHLIRLFQYLGAKYLADEMRSSARGGRGGSRY